ncbi:MAG: 50S ribosomal protein L23 [Candidatus Pacebacteria bacterium CG_4_10_14_0_8_um_filter_43_12]|nr:MAG: 50S ribosomal protein L23 [Candidatus Pacebacteria bacterium CG10_big_fil_rev_8_21_14_0_10_44_11]PIY79556.1 MAG: 50S ribosomal protein L23 [Candidatus Pacebacteria bacterium CG_4_10_14_0_8_um_filter_43_12]
MNPNTIKRPVITEKSVGQAAQANSYTFEVERNAHKNQIAEAIAQMYTVSVQSVRTIMRQSKSSRTGKKRLHALQPRTKKAVVTLKKGDSIALFDKGGKE